MNYAETILPEFDGEMANPSYAIQPENTHRIRTYVDFSQKSSLHFAGQRSLAQAAWQAQAQALQEHLLGGVRLGHAT